MYLLDTNICIAILKGNPVVIPSFRTHHQDCHLSSLVLAELYKGVYYSTRIRQNLEILTQFIQQFPIIPFEDKAAIEFGKIQAELRKIGKPTGQLDALIAAVARSHNDILVTNNIRHFENITSLTLENWLNS